MPTTRILLADSSTVHGLRVAGLLANQPDLEVVGRSRGGVDVLLHAAEADVVVLDDVGPDQDSLAERLLDEYPHLSVIAVDRSGSHALLFQLRPETVRLDNPSAADLLAAIRRTAARTDRAPAPTPHRSNEDGARP